MDEPPDGFGYVGAEGLEVVEFSPSEAHGDGFGFGKCFHVSIMAGMSYFCQYLLYEILEIFKNFVDFDNIWAILRCFWGFGQNL